MRQILKPGQPLNFTTPEETASLIAAAFDRNRNDTYRRLKGTIILDASGAGVAIEKTTRLFDLVLERITITSGPNAVVQFYENQVAPSDMVEVIGLGNLGVYSDAFSNSIFVEAGSQLYIAVAGGGANGTLTYNIQAKQIRSGV